MADLISLETRNKTFDYFSQLQPWLLRQLKSLKIERPTPVQYHCIPEIINGKDVIGAAKTGSGKTLTFVVPILHHFSIEPYGIFALILTPTRELAYQIAEQFKCVGAPAMLRQGAELNRSPHIVVATPGRLADIMETSPELTFKRIKFVVLDEADRLLDGRFEKQLKSIWKFLPRKRQTLLFSATITSRIQKMKDIATSNVFVWQSNKKESTVQQLEEKYSLVNPAIKDAAMVSLVLKLKKENPKGLAIIFTDTCKSTQILYMMMNELGIDSVCLHSMMKQKERLKALARFKSSQIKFLIATDLASRGLDIPLVQVVINHRIPNLPKTYIHRVGRTARAGRPGSAITFITPNEVKLLLAIEGETGRKMTQIQVNEDEIQKILREVNITKREQQIKLETSDFDERKIIYKRKRLICEGIDPDDEERKRFKAMKRKKVYMSK
ncbi:putative ATP-dependent RNA helicase DDX49 [Armadillidium nasatum]|uniref:RNA helicase n=1 Tax=Armadillidium nasatum TaxID=96803 RepID=A0A5N5TJ81_9CRUS|nr:putative ATP-dependent RNA helicase DDX49 [Armadillidium nasatum]